LRLGRAALTLIGITVAVFILTHLVGDPVLRLLGAEATPQDVAALRHTLGLDKPLYDQFWIFLGHAVHGNFGPSLFTRISSRTMLLRALVPSLLLAGASMGLAVVVGIPAGILSALSPGSRLDRLISSVTTTGIAMPEFWLALILIYIFGVDFHLLPTSGYGSWRNVILPALALSPHSVARIGQVTRSVMHDELRKDYVAVAYSKGLSSTYVVVHHALKNAALAITTQVGLETAELFAGRTIIIETIFAWPGVGRLTSQALLESDYPLVQTMVLWGAFVTVTINLVVDLSYAWLDPRIRYS